MIGEYNRITFEAIVESEIVNGEFGCDHSLSCIYKIEDDNDRH